MTSRSVGAAIGHLDALLATCPWHPTSFADDPARDALVEQLPRVPEIGGLIAPLRDQLWSVAVDLPTQLTHGDCNLGNVLVQGTTVRAFLDLDHLSQGPRARDLSYYLVSRLRRHLSQPETAERDCRAWVEALDHYVAGYHERHPLSEREQAAVVPLMLLIEIGSASWYLHGWVPSRDGYERSVATVGWLVDRFDELTARDRLAGRG